MTEFLWPDARQLLLLCAALGDAAEARAAFDAWRADFDPTGPIEASTYRLLPLLHHNLVAHGVHDGGLGMLAGVRRHAWCQTQIKARYGAAAISALARADIPTMVSKGLALAFGYYASPGLRPMSDADVVVPRPRLRDATEVVRRLGWTPHAQWRWSLPYAHAITFTRQDGGELDLHGALAHELMSPAAEQGIWERARPFVLAGERTLRPGASDLLMHTIIHGVRANVLSPVRWIADAMMILRRDGNAIDWHAMLDRADELDLLFRLRAGLLYLTEHLSITLPSTVADRLRTYKPRLLERLENPYLGGPPRSTVRVRSWHWRQMRLARMLTRQRRAGLPTFALHWIGRQIAERLGAG